MSKEAFLSQLAEALSGLPEAEVAERLTFYREMIEDRIEEGLSEEEAVAAIGTVDEIVAQILADIPLPTLIRERMKPARRFPAWEIVLLVLGFPLWFPLLVAAFAVLLSVYIVLWAVIVCLWAAEVSCIAGALGGVAAGLGALFHGNGTESLLLIGAGLALAGLSIYLFFGCKAATKGTLLLTKKIALGLKARLLRKESE